MWWCFSHCCCPQARPGQLMPAKAPAPQRQCSKCWCVSVSLFCWTSSLLDSQFLLDHPELTSRTKRELMAPIMPTPHQVLLSILSHLILKTALSSQFCPVFVRWDAGGEGLYNLTNIKQLQNDWEPWFKFRSLYVTGKTKIFVKEMLYI